MARPFYVTTPIYYVNDVPHLGTAYTTIVADALRRYHALRGRDARMLTGTDEHGLKIEREAVAKNVSPQRFVDEVSAKFREAWPKLLVEPNDFIRTTEPRHEKLVQEIWERVAKNGDVYLGQYEDWYCVGCESFKTEKELLEGNVCPLHNKPVERVKEETYFFKLKDYETKLLDYYDQNPGFIEPESRRNEVISFVKGGLKDLSVSRTSFTWGIPVPGNPKHIMFVWFDALANYWTALGDEGREILDAERRGRAPRRQGHPPLSRGLLAGVPLERGAAAADEGVRARLSDHRRSEDEQIAAQRGRPGAPRGDGRDRRRRRAPLSAAPRGRVRTRRRLRSRGDDRALQRRPREEPRQPPLAHARPLREANGRTTVPPYKPTDLEREFEKQAAALIEAAAKAWTELAPHRALEETFALSSLANQYVDRAAPWAEAKKGNQERVDTILALLLETLRALSVLVWPAIPRKADALRAQLALAPIKLELDKDLWPKLAFDRAGQALGTASVLFPTIDKEGEKKLLDRLQPKPEASEAAPPPSSVPGHPSAAPEIATISYDQFATVDLRVGLVKSAKKVPKKDKLLELEVDLGEDKPRTIIAGLALSFTPEQLTGQRVIVVANLAPRDFGKGLVSYGMLLASGPSEKLVLATAPEGAAPGAKLK